MNKYIDVKAAKLEVAVKVAEAKACKNDSVFHTFMDGYLNLFEADLDECKAADVQKVKHGKWLPLRFTLECSECGNSFAERNITIYDARTDVLAYAYYCPICGAKMDM